MPSPKPSAPIEIKLSKPISVKIIPDEKEADAPPWFAKAASLVSVLLLLLSLITMGLFVLDFGVADYEFDQTILPAALTIDWPHWTSVRDSFTVKVVLHNKGKDNLNGFVNLVLDPPNTVGMEEDGMTSVEIKELSPGASLTRTFKFVPLSGQGASPINLKVVVQNGTTTLEAAGNWQISVINIPRLQSLLAWLLGGSGLVATLTGLFWDKIKKVFA
jgi:hypothetical protein